MKRSGIWSLFAVLLFIGCNMLYTEPLVIGHRGAMGHETENTLASIQKALDLGVDMIEIDVFRVDSGEIVVFHDDRLDRLSNAKGKIEAYTVADLKQVVLKGDHKIPMLHEVLDLIANEVALNIELKGANTAVGVNGIIKDYVHERGWSSDNFIISSFNWEELRRMRTANPDIAIAVLTEGDPLEAIYTAKTLKATAINPYFKKLTEQNIKKMHDEGLMVYTWTVNKMKDIKKMKDFGVDGIITNYPERVN
ncbi:MAG: glycerophosphodiester phosphodiesterase family protein [Bacteroidota bacterium]